MSRPPSASSTGSPSNRSVSTTRKLAINTIHELHDRSNNYLLNRKENTAHPTDKSKRATFAALVSSLSSIGIDKLTNDELNSIENLTEEEKREKVNFMDKLVNRMVDNLSDNDGRVATLKQKLNDKHRIERPPLSIVKMTHNFKCLSSRMDIVFTAQYYLIHILSWDKPGLTLTFLVLYTWGCMDPYLFLVYPLIYITAGLMIPNYIYRHPLEKPETIPTRLRGDSSMFGFLKAENEWEKNKQEIEARKTALLEESLRRNSDLASVSSRTSLDSDEESGTGVLYELMTADSKSNILFKAMLEDEYSKKGGSNLVSDEPEEKPKSGVVGKIKLLINMRDLQNLTSDIIKLIDQFELLVYENCSFKDEKKSTRLFFSFAFLILVIVFLGPFIPWRFIIIASLWVALLLNHPKRAEFLLQFQKDAVGSTTDSKSRKETKTAGQLQVEKQLKSISQMIVDDPPQYRKVQIYQLEKQVITNPGKYEHYLYSTSIFNQSEETRLQRKKPKGAVALSQIQPPSSSWKYITETDWIVDRDVQGWCVFSNVIEEAHIGEDHWAYDLNGEFRRRRLVREVVRYSRPVKKGLR